jgi:hypothetical protein
MVMFKYLVTIQGMLGCFLPMPAVADEEEAAPAIAEITKVLKRGLKVEIDQKIKADEGGEPVTETSPDSKLTIRCNQTVFRPGDLMELQVSVKDACYLRLFYRDASGQFAQVFPNGVQPECRLEAGEKVKIPGDGAGFKFRVTEPAGDEVLLAVSSPEPFADTENFDFSDRKLFKPFKNLARVNAALRRGFRLEVIGSKRKKSPEQISHVSIGVRVVK